MIWHKKCFSPYLYLSGKNWIFQRVHYSFWFFLQVSLLSKRPPHLFKYYYIIILCTGKIYGITFIPFFTNSVRWTEHLWNGGNRIQKCICFISEKMKSNYSHQLFYQFWLNYITPSPLEMLSCLPDRKFCTINNAISIDWRMRGLENVHRAMFLTIPFSSSNTTFLLRGLWPADI